MKNLDVQSNGGGKASVETDGQTDEKPNRFFRAKSPTYRVVAEGVIVAGRLHELAAELFAKGWRNALLHHNLYPLEEIAALVYWEEEK